MKQYLKCLIVVAFVGLIASLPQKIHTASQGLASADKTVVPAKATEVATLDKQEPTNVGEPASITPVVPTKPPEPTPAPKPVGCEQYRAMLAQYAWDVNIAMAVMQAESTTPRGPCDAEAENAHDGHTTCLGSRGLFQIGCDSTNNYAGMFDASANIAQAYALYSRRGWQPWTTYTSGRYLRYL